MLYVKGQRGQVREKYIEMKGAFCRHYYRYNLATASVTKCKKTGVSSNVPL